MGITGKYSFPGIQKAGASLIRGLLASTTWGLWLIKSPLSGAVDAFDNMLVNYLANKGLVIFNLVGILVDGKIDQDALDKAIDDGFDKLKIGRDKITSAQGKAIDDAVIEAARKDIDFGAAP